MTTTTTEIDPQVRRPSLPQIGKGERARRVVSPDFSGPCNERSHTVHKLSHKTKLRHMRQAPQNRRHNQKRKAHRHRQKLASLSND
jgi:hypothetical protein